MLEVPAAVLADLAEAVTAGGPVRQPWTHNAPPSSPSWRVWMLLRKWVAAAPRSKTPLKYSSPPPRRRGRHETHISILRFHIVHSRSLLFTKFLATIREDIQMNENTGGNPFPPAFQVGDLILGRYRINNIIHYNSSTGSHVYDAVALHDYPPLKLRQGDRVVIKTALQADAEAVRKEYELLQPLATGGTLARAWPRRSKSVTHALSPASSRDSPCGRFSTSRQAIFFLPPERSDWRTALLRVLTSFIGPEKEHHVESFTGTSNPKTSW